MHLEGVNFKSETHISIEYQPYQSNTFCCQFDFFQISEEGSSFMTVPFLPHLKYFNLCYVPLTCYIPPITILIMPNYEYLSIFMYHLQSVIFIRARTMPIFIVILSKHHNIQKHEETEYVFLECMTKQVNRFFT